MLSVLVVGGGPGGLVVASFLAREGHHVIVLEHKHRYSESGQDASQGLNLTSNAKRCLFALGLEHEFKAIADSGDTMRLMRSSDGECFRQAQTPYGFSFVHRMDLLQMLLRCARNNGVEFLLGDTFSSIKGHEKSTSVHLASGKMFFVDLVIGADGASSKVRSTLYDAKEFEPALTGHCTFLIDVSESEMQKHQATAELYEDGKNPYHLYLGPQRSIISWTMTRRKIYHLQMNDHSYGQGEAYGEDCGAQSQYIAKLANMVPFRKRWADFEPAIRHILDSTESCLRWKIAELPELPTWSSANGNIILLGDAAHLLPPFSGQGSALAMEDATVLATLLSCRPAPESLPNVAKAYEHLRRPRVQGFREIIQANMQQFGMSDARTQEQNAKAAGGPTTETGSKAGWTSDERYRWINCYDAVDEAQKYMGNVKI